MTSLTQLRINPRAEKRLKSGHLWLYSNEIEHSITPLNQVAAGSQCAIENAHGKIIAYAFMNPSALLCGRIVSRKKPLDYKQLKQRISDALALRQQCFHKPFYRLFYAEGDYLPGLIIDRFGDVCVVQINSLGLEAFQADIANILQQLLNCQGILFRNDGGSRELEGMAASDDVIYGDVPEVVEIEENNTRFLIPVKSGQKTGWFYDHRDNRAKLLTRVKGKRVLDVFSYIGGWGLQALNHGAQSLTAIDASEFALDCLEKNAAINGFADTVMAIQGNAFDAMKALIEDQQKFDVIIVDPPAFIKKKKDHNKGLQAYRKLNELALRLLEKNGLLVSASCSMQLSSSELQNTVQLASRHIDRSLSLIYKNGHAMDHPLHPAIKENEYLKAQFYQLR